MIDYHIYKSLSTIFPNLLSFDKKRRRRDLNPRAAINDLLPFQGSPFGQLGYFSKTPYLIHYLIRKRRRWDSNPRALSDKRFSRPPRYDHFDTSPVNRFLLPLSATFVILSHLFRLVNNIFQKNFCNFYIFWCCDFYVLI